MKFSLIVFIGFFGLSTVWCQLSQLNQLNREFKARRCARQCVVEQKVSYDVALKFSKGDLSDDSQKAKCFVKCFAHRIGFLNSTNDFQRDEFLKYVEFVVPKNIEAAPILDKCQSIIVKGSDQCDNCYRAYKCFWEGVKEAEASMSNESLRFSLYDVLGFNRLYDEEEIRAENELQDENETQTEKEVPVEITKTPVKVTVKTEDPEKTAVKAEDSEVIKVDTTAKVETVTIADVEIAAQTEIPTEAEIATKTEIPVDDVVHTKTESSAKTVDEVTET